MELSAKENEEINNAIDLLKTGIVPDKDEEGDSFWDKEEDI